MERQVKFIEVGPRDGFQSVKGNMIPTQLKLEIMERLLNAGVSHMEFTSFVSPKAIPQLADITYHNPTCHGKAEIEDAYYAALRLAANLGLDVSAYSRIVYDAHSPVATGAEYIAASFAWESAGYYWHITGIGCALDGPLGVRHTDDVSRLVGGGNWQSRREAYMAFYPVLNGSSKDEPIS